jgi:carboxypeptidase family protein
MGGEKMKASNLCAKALVIPIFLSLFLIAFGSVSHAATISGTIYKSNGTTLLNDATIRVIILSGDPCGWPQYVNHIDTSNGSYTTPDLSPGTYYLITDNLNQSNYVNEWWADPTSVPFPDCGNAQSITVESTNIIDKDFQLDTGYDVSGTVYEESGTTPVLNHGVQLILGDSCEMWVAAKNVYSGSEDGIYTFKGVPDGYYYLRTDNQSGSDYVNEWWVDTDTNYSSYLCSDAMQLNVGGSNVSGIDFRLDAGGSISGTVSDDGGPITGGNGIHVDAFIGDSCGEEGSQYIGGGPTDTGDGTYQIRGLPASTDIYLKTNTSDYANKWWESTEDGTYSCASAQATNVTSGVNTLNRNFLLEPGGSLTGVVVDKNNSPQENIEVSCWNDAARDWKSTLTAANGSFTLSNLAPGPTELEIEPDVDTGFVMWWRDYWLDEKEDRDLGNIRLQDGALVSGFIKHIGVGLDDVEYTYGGKFEIGWGDTEYDGSFEFRLPLGTYTLTLYSEDGYSMVPVEINVTDVNVTYNQGDLAAYNHTNGRSISGTVTDSAVHYGEFEVLAFLNDQEFTPDIAGGICEMAFAEPDFDASGGYQLYVPDTLNKVKLMFVLWSEDENELETMTVLDIMDDVTAPSSVNDYAYNSAGHTIDGYVKDQKTGEGIYLTEVMLCKQVGGEDEFAGFAEADNTGKYTFYNVRPGTYRIAVNAIDYRPDTKWSSTFDVSANFTVPDINMSKTMAMPWIYLLLLSD